MSVTENMNMGFDGSWFLIILFLFAFMGWGGNGYGAGQNTRDGYVLSSDFAQVDRRLDSITNGLCDGFYSQAQLSNGINANLMQQGYETRNAVTAAQITEMQNANALQAQIAQCCCNTREAIEGLNYNIADKANGITNAIQTGFCQTNFNMQNGIRDVVDNANANTRAILDFMTQARFQDLQRENDALRLAASQTAQNAYLISQLKTEA